MSGTQTFEYNRTYNPAAPFVPIEVDGYAPDGRAATLLAFVDSGADGTLLPSDILQAVGAEYADAVRLYGSAGGVQQADRYTVRIRVGGQTVHGVAAVAIEAGGEPILGRDVLNSLRVTLNGPAGVTELSLE